MHELNLRGLLNAWKMWRSARVLVHLRANFWPILNFLECIGRNFFICDLKIGPEIGPQVDQDSGGFPQIVWGRVTSLNAPVHKKVPTDLTPLMPTKWSIARAKWTYRFVRWYLDTSTRPLACDQVGVWSFWSFLFYFLFYKSYKLDFPNGDRSP